MVQISKGALLLSKAVHGTRSLDYQHSRPYTGGHTDLPEAQEERAGLLAHLVV